MIHVGENTWNLRIFITDLQVEKQLRVRGDQHIGGIMLQLVDPEHPKDWSDHALWWPERNIWLSRTRSTLDQVGVQADCLLHFTPMHKILRVQLPDLRFLDCRVDFSTKTFGAVVSLCRDLDIRHPEELSLCKPLEAEHLKKNFGKFPPKKVPIAEPNGTVYLQPAPDTNSFIPMNSSYKGGSIGSLDRTQNGNFQCSPMSPYGTTPRRGMSSVPGTPSSPTWKNSSNGYATFDSGSSLGDFQENLAASPRSPSPDVRSRLVRPKTLIEKARMNVGWLDSSLSIMEQGIREYDTLCLRFKYYTFFDLNPKYDQVRINQLYEQAKWAILNEEIDCTEEESLMFAALQFQINQQNETYQGFESRIGSSMLGSGGEGGTDDDIESALNELQISLEGGKTQTDGNITKIPELTDYLRFLKPRKFTLKGYKRYYFTYRDLHLHLYKSAEESRRAPPTITINLRGCEVTPDIVLSQGKFAIKLEVPPDTNGPNSEVWIRCENEDQYAKWMAACRLAAKGRSLADSSYETEVSNIKTLLNLQKPAHGVPVNIDPRSIDTFEYLSPRMLRKLSSKAAQRILEAHANVSKLSLVDAKLKYIQAWQSLPNFGVSLFVIKFDGHKKEELLGVAYNRIMRMDLSTGDHIKTWRYNNMKAWNVNWGIKCMMIQFHDENVVFSVQSADCKVVHEFIGGYIFMSMRSKENNQTLNEELFHKLTGGWV
ncbi:unc-112-related protein-like [Haematobia irritans]|uniref:unc-112-related protein-like n=1 Tax=Haematobia irritans TaxID=7368 RepID=UPI003F5053E8